MLTYPRIDPVAFQFGFWSIRWYGFMYLLSALVCWPLLVFRNYYYANSEFTLRQLADIVFFSMTSAIIGARLGFCIFYDLPHFISNPLVLFQTQNGGMSFHGGFIGILMALLIYAKRINKPFLSITDLALPIMPIPLGLGRLGNFINDELWGIPTLLPWGMVFPNGGPLPRHPAQLYEMFLEGLVLLVILWIYARKPRPLGAVSSLFVLCYGVFRFLVEFVKEPDLPAGYLLGGFTFGQILTLPLILIGSIYLIRAYRRERKPDQNMARS